jgi:hypothetical protein
LVGRAVILEIMYVETFKSDVILLSVTYNVVKVTQTENCQYDSVSELVCWYWKYHPFKSEKKMPKLSIKLNLQKIEKVGLFTNKCTTGCSSKEVLLQWQKGIVMYNITYMNTS